MQHIYLFNRQSCCCRQHIRANTLKKDYYFTRQFDSPQSLSKIPIHTSLLSPNLSVITSNSKLSFLILNPIPSISNISIRERYLLYKQPIPLVKQIPQHIHIPLSTVSLHQLVYGSICQFMLYISSKISVNSTWQPRNLPNTCIPPINYFSPATLPHTILYCQYTSPCITRIIPHRSI